MNNFIACGDLHADKNKPRYRKDNYWGTWQHKMLWVINLANERNARLLIAGDIFNTSRVSPDVTNVALAIFKEAKYQPYVVAGQHDLKYHTDIEKTPLFTLAIARVVKIIQGHYKEFTGAGFEEGIPQAENKFLITHTCITPRRPPFYLTDAVSAKKFMRMHPGYEIIISGDYHVPFHTKLGSRHLINTGTLIRNKKDMKNYVPYVWYIHTSKDIQIEGTPLVSIEKIRVPHEPYEDVFDVDAIEYEEQHGITIDTERLKHLVESGIEHNNLDSIVWTLYKQLKKEGTIINKQMTEEILENA